MVNDEGKMAIIELHSKTSLNHLHGEPVLLNRGTNSDLLRAPGRAPCPGASKKGVTRGLYSHSLILNTTAKLLHFT